jgi:predicted TIM-barrel fold metal-dependent hydrolase
MRVLHRVALFTALCAGLTFSAFAASTGADEKSPAQDSLKAFAALHPIDTHVHVFKSDPAFQNMLDRLHLTLLNILVVDDTEDYRKQLQPQVDDALKLVRSSNGHVALCTTFDPYKFNDPSFAAEAVKQINQNFGEGAVAVKAWKNIGMEIKDAKGNFIMPDDPKLTPIYKDIAQHHKTLLTHFAEPDAAWEPLEGSDDPSASYYRENPQWHLYKKAGFPSKKQILDARDHVLASNPELRMIGVHLGSMERDLDNIGRHLDQYPNFAVDTAARMEYLMLAPADKVRAFLTKYQDRVVYGTDLDLIAKADVPETLKDWESTYERDWKYLATEDTIEVNGRKIQGLKLPEPILRKLFHDNALHWIPDLKPAK